MNELDLGIGRTCAFGRTRLNVALDLLNALNLSTILVPTRPSFRRRVAGADRHADAGDDGAHREVHRLRLL